MHRTTPYYPKTLPTVPVPSRSELMRRFSLVARAAHVRGNAAGLHGGRRARYGKAERQAARREERRALGLCLAGPE